MIRTAAHRLAGVRDLTLRLFPPIVEGICRSVVLFAAGYQLATVAGGYLHRSQWWPWAATLATSVTTSPSLPCWQAGEKVAVSGIASWAIPADVPLNPTQRECRPAS